MSEPTWKGEGITVRELIEQLQQVDPDMLTVTDGCDCYGPCSGTEVYDGRLILVRGQA